MAPRPPAGGLVAVNSIWGFPADGGTRPYSCGENQQADQIVSCGNPQFSNKGTLTVTPLVR